MSNKTVRELVAVLKAICDQSDEFRKNGYPRKPKPEKLYQRARAAIARAEADEAKS